MGEQEDLLNGVINDVNARLDMMNQCMGQRINKFQVEVQMNSMQRAFIEYHLARTHKDTGKNDDQMDKLRDAWKEHVLVATTEFDNVAKSADYFIKLLIPMQDFAQSFVLISFDYLKYLHELDEPNYKGAFEETIDAFVQLRTWADKARSVTLSSLSKQMRSKPCNNGAFLDNEMTKWNTAFTKTNINPIVSYIGELYKFHYTLTRVESQTNCYAQGQCEDGYMDKTNGNTNWWGCGVGCIGGKHLTDGLCNCACIPNTGCEHLSGRTRLLSVESQKMNSTISEN